MSEAKDNLENLGSERFEDGFQTQDLPSAEIQRRLNLIELEAKALDLEIKREQVGKIRSQREQAKAELMAKIASTREFMARRAQVKLNCNHHKGGIGAQAIVNGMGSSTMWCLIRHRLPIGRDMVLCQRCGGEWLPENPYVNPPVRATEGYVEMLRNSQLSDNTASGASVFLFSGTYPFTDGK